MPEKSVLSSDGCVSSSGHRSRVYQLKPVRVYDRQEHRSSEGRVKEAAGSLTGDQGLKNEGHAHQAKGFLKKAVDKVAETVKGHNRSNERG